MRKPLTQYEQTTKRVKHFKQHKIFMEEIIKNNNSQGTKINIGYYRVNIVEIKECVLYLIANI